MKYLAVVRLSPWVKIERMFKDEKEAQIWAFKQNGQAEIVVSVKDDFARRLLTEVALKCSPEIKDNRN